MACQLGVVWPTPTSNPPLTASRVTDPYRPVNAWPAVVGSPEGNWTDANRHTIVRNGWGQWVANDTSMSGGQQAATTVNGVASFTQGTSTGGAMSGYGDVGPLGSRPYPAGKDPKYGVGGNQACAASGCQADFVYPRIDLFTMKDGVTPITTPADWWVKRRPEIANLVQNELYGVPWTDPTRWPNITWNVSTPTTSQVTTGAAAGIQYLDRTYTGTIHNICGTSVNDPDPPCTANPNFVPYPGLRNMPVITFRCWTPLSAHDAGTKVPVIVQNGSASPSAMWTATGPAGIGACGFNLTQLQPDSGGANLSSYIIGLMNQGDWRKPSDPGSLVAYAWGLGRMIDYWVNDPDIDADKIAAEGHSRWGKATLVQAAYDDRVVAALPSCGGELGTSWIRRLWGETVESVAGTSEYHWVAGNLMNYVGAQCFDDGHGHRTGPAGCTPSYFPRRAIELDVDVHSVMSLVAPRAIMTNGGDSGDSWQDPRGMFLAGALSSPVWELLKWPGQIIPPGTVFTTNPNATVNGSGGTEVNGDDEAIGGTPPFNQAFIAGTVGYRRHVEGHTDTPDLPTFVTFASRYLNDTRPVLAAGQNFALLAGTGTIVGQVEGTPGGGGPLQNFQIKGGNAAYAFALDPETGWITIPDRTRMDAAISTYALTVMASDGILPSHDQTVNIILPQDLTARGIMTTTRSGFVYDSTSGRFSQTVTLTNKSIHPVSGPISLLFDNLSAGASVYNPAGVTMTTAPLYSPYINYDATLAPGQSVNVTVEFTAAANTSISYLPRILAGSTPR